MLTKDIQCLLYAILKHIDTDRTVFVEAYEPTYYFVSSTFLLDIKSYYGLSFQQVSHLESRIKNLFHEREYEAITKLFVNLTQLKTSSCFSRKKHISGYVRNFCQITLVSLQELTDLLSLFPAQCNQLYVLRLYPEGLLNTTGTLALDKLFPSTLLNFITRCDLCPLPKHLRLTALMQSDFGLLRVHVAADEHITVTMHQTILDNFTVFVALGHANIIAFIPPICFLYIRNIVTFVDTFSFLLFVHNKSSKPVFCSSKSGLRWNGATPRVLSKVHFESFEREKNEITSSLHRCLFCCWLSSTFVALKGVRTF